MSRLVPVQRTDRTGRTQVRWVREGTADGVGERGGRTVPKPFVYTPKAAAREFAAMLVERGGGEKAAAEIGRSLSGYSERARIAAADALDQTYNAAGVGVLAHAVRSDDEGFLLLACEAIDFCADLLQSIYDLRDAGPSANRVQLAPLANSTEYAYDEMRGRFGYEDGRVATLEGEGLQLAADRFKAALLMGWTGVKLVNPLPDVTHEIDSVQRSMPLIEPAAGVIALVHEGLLDWANAHGQLAERAAFCADTATEIARTAVPGCGPRFYELARDRGAFEPEIAAAILASESPAIAEGLL